MLAFFFVYINYQGEKMADISGFGTVVTLKGTKTFPNGITLTQFADDADPFDLPSIQLADKAMGVNGHLITWSKANPLLLNLNFIPGESDDLNLTTLADANRVSVGKTSVGDVITITAVYPSGRTLTLQTGTITDAMLGESITSAGRIKTKTFAFAFESMSRS